MPFPHIDPIAFHLFNWPVRWYGIAYFVAFLFASTLMKRYNKTLELGIKPEYFDHLLTVCILGVVIGGRLGHMFFYDFHHMVADPLSIFKIWEGGMAFHGGLIGCVLGAYLYTRKHNLPFLTIFDLMSIAAPLGIFCVRIANFINAELYGRVTTLPCGVIFPNQEYPRHPSQLYEAFLEGILLFILLRLCLPKIRTHKGYLTSLFLIGYGMSRFLVEYVREPSDGLFSFGFFDLTYGQFLTLPMIFVGLFGIIKKQKIK